MGGKTLVTLQKFLNRLVFTSALSDLINRHILIQVAHQLFCGVADGGKLCLA